MKMEWTELMFMIIVIAALVAFATWMLCEFLPVMADMMWMMVR